MVSNRFGLFNADWYLAQNPDVAQAVRQGLITVEEHFELFGAAEGRAPGPLFDPHSYLANHPDVAQAVAAGLITAYEHFTQFGAAEGRSPLSLFDPGFYLAQNPDVAAAVEAGLITAVEHFLLYGQGEPRQITPFINLGDYLRANADLARANEQGIISPLAHLLTYGVAEGRDLGNGISLSVFADDPAFQNAVANGNLQGALQRVAEVAPFLPAFEPPAGWAPPANTPIPTDFTPPPGSQLVIPPSVVVPPDTELPAVFAPVAPPPPADGDNGPTPPPPPPGDDDGPPPPPPPPFSVLVSGAAPNTTLSFAGTATGDITINTSGAHLVFMRDGYEAAARPAIADIAAQGIPALSGNDKLVVSNIAFHAMHTKLAADVSLKVTDSNQSLTYASVSLSTLKAMEEATTGFIDASIVQTTYGTVEEALHVLVTRKGADGDAIAVAPNIRVGLSTQVADASDLRKIEEATTGTVAALNLTHLTGSTADTLHILVTKKGESGDVIYVQPQFQAAVTLTDVGSFADTQAILHATTGAVTTGLIPGGTYGRFAKGDKIATGLEFQNHTSQATLQNDNELNWKWDGTSRTLTVETLDINEAGKEDAYATITYTLTGISSVSEADGVFTLSA